MVNHTTGYIGSEKKDRIRKLFYNYYTPKSGSIRAAILIVHGMKEHSGRYDFFARFLSQNECAVITYDHCGHGLSVNNDSELGFFQKNKPADQLIHDCKLFAEKLKEYHPNIPRFILGHSMGSFISRLLLQENHGEFHGAIIVGTGGKNPAAHAFKPIINLLNKISPCKRSRFINKMFDKINNIRFEKEEDATSSSWLSLDKSNRDAFDNDPLCGFPFSNNGFYTLIALNTTATKSTWADDIPRQFPFLFVSGADDPIGDFGKGVENIVSKMKLKGFTSVELKLYDKMRHEILNESIKNEVYKDILEWIENQIH